MTFSQNTLPNGLRIASEALEGVETVSVAVSAGTGSRAEEETENGISHMLEHMAFKGTSTRTARQIAELFDGLGGVLNAYTSNEQTVYYAKVLKEDLETAMELLSDILLRPIFPEDELEKEKQVVLQEIAMHLDSPEDVLFDHFQEIAFPGQPLGRSILGTEARVKGFSKGDLARFMKQHYGAGNIVVTAAGNIDRDRFAAMAERYFSPFATAQKQHHQPASYQGGVLLREYDFEQVHLAVGFPTIGHQDPDYYTAQVLGMVLGGGMSSRLFHEIREKRGLAYHISSFLSPFADIGLFTIYTATSSHLVPELMPALTGEIFRMLEDMEPEEIQRAKNQVKAGLLMARESTSTVAEWIGRHLLIYGRYWTAKEITAKIDAIQQEDLLRVYQRLLASKTPTLAAIGPIGNPAPYELLAEKLRA